VREGLKVQVAKLDLQGYTQRDIAEKLDIGQSTAHVLLKEVQEDYQQAFVDDRKAMVRRATAAHLDVIRECHEQIAKLKARGRVRRHIEAGTNAKGEFRKRSVTREPAELGHYLSIIQNGWREIALLHGLKDLPAQIFNVQVNSSNPVQDMLDRMLAIAGGAEELPALTSGAAVVVGATPSTEPVPRR
jgi:transposase